MTKLFIATGIFHPESGGPATYLYHLLPHLQAQGFRVQVLTYGDPQPDDADAYPYPVTRIPRTSLPTRLAAYAQAARPLMTWSDLIYQHTLMLPLYRLPFTPERPRIMKVVGDQVWERAVRNRWIPPTTDIDQFQINHPPHQLIRWNRRLRRREIRQLRGVIVPSQYLRKMVTYWGIPSSRVRVIYNAPPPHPPLAITQAEAREQLELEPKQPLILTAARLVAWKGIDSLIAAATEFPNLHLVIAGDGVQRGELEQLAQSNDVADRVTFLGRVPREQLQLYMKAADYLALYSGYEGLSHVLLESLYAGTPVIASNKGGNPEIVQHEVNGLLVPYGNPQALTDTLREALQPGKRDQLAAGISDTLERFTFERMVTETVDALNTLRW